MIKKNSTVDSNYYLFILLLRYSYIVSFSLNVLPKVISFTLSLLLNYINLLYICRFCFYDTTPTVHVATFPFEVFAVIIATPGDIRVTFPSSTLATMLLVVHVIVLSVVSSG